MQRSAFALNSSRPPELRVDLPGGDLAEQVRLGAGRRGLATGGRGSSGTSAGSAPASGRSPQPLQAEAIASAPGLGQRSTGRITSGPAGASAPVPRGPIPTGLGRDRLPRHEPPEPIAVQGSDRARSYPGQRQSGQVLQVSDHQVGVVADDLAGVEQVRRVEGVLDLAEDLDELAVLPAQELGPRQAAALHRRDRPAGLDAPAS